MGCLQSKLYGTSTIQQKYQSKCIKLNKKYNPNKKKMVKIDPNISYVESDNNQLKSLNEGLQNAISGFQNNKGLISCTFLSKKQISPQRQQKSIEKSQIQRNVNIQSQIKQQQHVVQGMFSKSQLNATQSCINSQIFDWNCKNNKIVSLTQLSTQRQLQKQLFYINSNAVGNTCLQNWFQKGRTSLQFCKQMLIESIKQYDFYFLIALFQISAYQRRNTIKFLACKKFEKSTGYRIYVNGIKRMLKIKTALQPNNTNLTSHLKQISSTIKSLSQNNVSLFVYSLTGWIPQAVQLSSSQVSKQIIKRLAKNFFNQNIVICFANKDLLEFVIPFQIDQKQQTMKCIIVSKFSDIVQQVIDWQSVCNKFGMLYVNWNPLIYTFNKKLQGIIVPNIQQHQMLEKKQQAIPIDQKLKYVLKIPPSRSQVQVRVFIQLHWSQFLEKAENFEILLYQIDGYQLNIQQKYPIKRIKSNNKYFLSQIFIFQRSQEQSQFLILIKINQAQKLPLQNLIKVNQSISQKKTLSIQKDNKDGLKRQKKQQPHDSDVQMTIDLYTFCQIDVKNYKEPVLLQTKGFETNFKIHNAGFGMNSPYFDKNIQFSIKTLKNTVCKLHVDYESTKDINFQLYVTPDHNKYKDITLFRSAQIVQDIVQSQSFQNAGTFQFFAEYQYYIIIIVCFTPAKGFVNFVLQVYQTTQTLFNHNCKEEQPDQICVQLINNGQDLDEQIQINWKKQNSGPRNRTKNNSLPIYYQLSQFSDYFQNPYIDYSLAKGRYQFMVMSKTFAKNFNYSQFQQNELQAALLFLNANPPSLSMAIYQLNQNKSLAKIVVDDIEYIPYGMGFRTQPMQMQEGVYRFIFSKIQTSDEQGIFKIRKIDNL